MLSQSYEGKVAGKRKEKIVGLKKVLAFNHYSKMSTIIDL